MSYGNKQDWDKKVISDHKSRIRSEEQKINKTLNNLINQASTHRDGSPESAIIIESIEVQRAPKRNLVGEIGSALERRHPQTGTIKANSLISTS